jgi:UDP-galactopyranose mutase
MKYDYLVVGAGLFGCVFAHEATTRGKSCLVIDKRSHIGGNVYTDSVDGIEVHRYGAHIFHTDDKEVWEYLGQFADFNRYTKSPLANFRGELYNLPFNMNTFYRLWGVTKPDEARRIIESQRLAIESPQNLEEQALSLVGRDLYEKLIKGYTEKQWGRDCKDLPAFIIKRLPLRFVFDNNYFNDQYQGIPIGGYTQMIGKMLEGSDIRLATDYFAHREELDKLAATTVYTGMLDEYFGYRFGHLEYRTLRFESETLNQQNFQGNAVVNYTDWETPYTRIIEHKHFTYGTQPTTVITREYPKEFAPGDEPYYPVNDEKNNALYAQYRTLADTEQRVLFGGRLADYKY